MAWIIDHTNIQGHDNGALNRTLPPIKVLMYHRIVHRRELCRSHPVTCVHVDQFARQMKLLDRWGFTTITIQDYLLFLRSELGLPKKPIILTFDDGYLDTYEVAFPILQQYGMKAVVFALGDRQTSSNFWDNDQQSREVPLMNAHQFLELQASGFEIGSHSLRHPKLIELPRERSWEEISRSRMLLEIMLNSPVYTFSYPFGLLNETIKDMVVNAGYQAGCATFSGPARFGTDLFEIRRVSIEGTLGLFGFAARVLTPFEYSLWAYWRVKELVRSRPNSNNGHKLAPSQIADDTTLSD